MSPQRLLRRLWPFALSALALACSGSDGGGASSGSRQAAVADYRGGRPNIVLIVVDTLRGDAVMAPKKVPVPTPHLDALAADGIAFPKAFSHAPITLPSHTALFSSRPPFMTGVLNNGQKVDEDLPLVAEYLSDFGYATRAVISLGTLNLGKTSNVHRGFDAFDTEFYRMSRAPEIVERLQPHMDVLEGDQPFFLFAHFSDPHEPYNAHGETEADAVTADVYLDGELLETVSTSVMTLRNYTIEVEPGDHVIELRSDKPMMTRSLTITSKGRPVAMEGDEEHWLVGQRLKPHDYIKFGFETDASERECDVRLWVSDRPNRAQKKLRYYQEVKYADQWVGTLLEQLKQRGLYDNALIVFTSDHGEALNDRGKHVGHIQTLYDEQIHVPLIIKPPKDHPHIPALAAAAEGVAPHVDLVPTILKMSGLPPLEGQTGNPLMDGGTGNVIAQTHRPQAQHDIVCLRDAEWKMIYIADTEQFELYDLVNDPGERKNVYHELKGERPDWTAMLIEFAKNAQAGKAASEDGLTSALEALGYAGNEVEGDDGYVGNGHPEEH